MLLVLGRSNSRMVVGEDPIERVKDVSRGFSSYLGFLSSGKLRLEITRQFVVGLFVILNTRRFLGLFGV